MALLSPEDHALVARAVARAERESDGEIVTIVSPRSDAYHDVGLHYAVLAMLLVFLGSWFAQSLTNWRMFDDDLAAHGEPGISWLTYVRGPDFWNRTLQNWQSEFLAVATLAAFSIYLRQRGSPESKPAGAPDDETGSSG